MAIRPLLQGLPEAFADPDTGIGADLMDIDPNEVEENYYEKCASHLNDGMNMKQEDNTSAKEYATEKYGEVERPFHLNSGLSRDAFDYIELYILVLAILCTAIAAPVFANEYQTGSDSIFRCAKHGRMRLAITRIAAFGCIFIGTFIVGTGILISILNLCFGTDCLKTSMQMLFSIINLPDYNLGQLQIILAAAGLLSVLASMSCTMFLSAKCKDSVTALLLSIVVLLLPAISYIAIGGSTWVFIKLPFAGLGIEDNYLFQLIHFYFLTVGDMSLWLPQVILVLAVI